MSIKELIRNMIDEYNEDMMLYSLTPLSPFAPLPSADTLLLSGQQYAKLCQECQEELKEDDMPLLTSIFGLDVIVAPNVDKDYLECLNKKCPDLTGF